jgi:hypothetical protein
MPNSKTIAGLIGPTLVAMCLALLVNLNSFPALVESLSRDPMLIFVSAFTIAGGPTGRCW